MVEDPVDSGLYVPQSDEDPDDSQLYIVPTGLVEDPLSSNFFTTIGNVGGVDGSSFANCQLKVVYDDTWPSLREALGDTPYRIETAPWYIPTVPESGEFAGVWIMDVQGLDVMPIQREVTEMIGAGGVASPHRDTTRPITFNALIIASTNAGARYGLNWLTSQLRKTTSRSGGELTYYAAHPEDRDVGEAEPLRRKMRSFVLTAAPSISELGGKGGQSRHRQSSMWRVEWTLTALDPYAYRDPAPVPVVWVDQVEESIEWVHAPDCSDAASCSIDIPILFNADCTPQTIDLTTSPIPTCGGCLPVCSVESRTFVLAPSYTGFDETAVSMRVTNTAASGSLTVNMYWRPVGMLDVCDRVNPIQVAGLPPGATAVADSISGRPYAEVAGVRHRQVGIVSTQSGAPWVPMIIDRTQEWELVAENTPGASYTIELSITDRES